MIRMCLPPGFARARSAASLRGPERRRKPAAPLSIDGRKPSTKSSVAVGRVELHEVDAALGAGEVLGKLARDVGLACARRPTEHGLGLVFEELDDALQRAVIEEEALFEVSQLGRRQRRAVVSAVVVVEWARDLAARDVVEVREEVRLEVPPEGAQRRGRGRVAEVGLVGLLDQREHVAKPVGRDHQVRGVGGDLVRGVLLHQVRDDCLRFAELALVDDDAQTLLVQDQPLDPADVEADALREHVDSPAALAELVREADGPHELRRGVLAVRLVREELAEQLRGFVGAPFELLRPVRDAV